MINSPQDNLLLQLATDFSSGSSLWSFLQHAKVNIDASNEKGETALHLVIKAKAFHNVRTLLDKRAHPNILDLDGNTPFHLAAENGKDELVEQFLQAGAIIDVLNNNNQTIFDLAKKSANKRSIILIQKALNNLFLRAVKEGKIDAVESYLLQGADINSRNREDSDTALHIALKNGKTKLAKYLIDHGINIQLLNDDLVSPLHLAAMIGVINLVELLVEKGAFLNATDKSNGTPLHYAILNDTKSAKIIIYLLIEKDADSNITPRNDFSFLSKAIFRGYSEIIPKIISKSNNINYIEAEHGYSALHAAVLVQDFKSVKSLVYNGVDIYRQNINKQTAADLANKINAEIAQFLTARTTKLISAASNGNLKLVKNNFKAKIDIADSLKEMLFGYLPLKVAVKNGHTQVVEFFIQSGIKLGYDLFGNSFLHMAAQYEHCDIIKIFIEAGLDPKAANIKGVTALDLTHTCVIAGANESNPDE